MLILFLVLQVGGLFLLSRRLDRRLSTAFIALFHSQRLAVWVMALVFLPGTLVHELAHLVVARLLLVRAGHLTIMPRVEGDHIVMGSVLVPKTDPVRRFVIGVAPVVVGLTIIVGMMWLVPQFELLASWQGRLVMGYVVFEVANTLFASKADMEGALGLFALMTIIVGLLYWLGFRLSTEWIEPLVQQHQAVLAQSVRWLWLPIGIDAVLLAGLWVLFKLVRIRVW